jgi:carbon storage regulator
MLVLSRKQSQRIRLGDSIVITVVRLTGDKVRLGIEAPKDMLVLRDELETFEPGKGTAQRSCEPTAPIASQQLLPLQRSA